MKPEEKAKELVDKFLKKTPVKDFTKLTVEESGNELLRDLHVAKQCALICVEEILKSNPTESYSDPFIGISTHCEKSYWKKVKQQIQKL